MCGECLAKGILAAIFAGVFATLFFATFWMQASLGGLLTQNLVLLIFGQYAVAFFFLGLAKWVKMTIPAHKKAAKPEKVTRKR
jgi:hypothetical protein